MSWKSQVVFDYLDAYWLESVTSKLDSFPIALVSDGFSKYIFVVKFHCACSPLFLFVQFNVFAKS